PLVELETEKATTEIRAPVAGRLRVSVPEGKTVAVGTVVGRIEEGVTAPAPASKSTDGKTTPKAAPKPAEPAKAAAAPPPREVVLSPAARRLAEEAKVDVNALEGTGRGGRITKEDVVTHLEHQKQSPAQPAPHPTPPPPVGGGLGGGAKEAPPETRPGPAERETRQRMSAIRQRIAERLVASQKSTASLTTFNEIDMSAVMELRTRYKERFREKYG